VFADKTDLFIGFSKIVLAAWTLVIK